MPRKICPPDSTPPSDAPTDKTRRRSRSRPRLTMDWASPEAEARAQEGMKGFMHLLMSGHGIEPETRFHGLCDRVLTILNEAESLVVRLREMTKPPQDAREDDPLYIDLTQKEPLN